jgi:hypothetical protein
MFNKEHIVDSSYGPNNRALTIRCPSCAKIVELMVPTKEFYEWQKGEFIQKAMASVSVEDRETIISGLCSNCQDDLDAYAEWLG